MAMTIAVALAVGSRRSARTAAMYHVERHFRNVRIVASSDRVEFRGLDRVWDGQWRGLGVLVLTDEILYFRLADRNMDLSVPVSRIDEVRVDGEGDGRRMAGGRCQIRVGYRAFDDQPRTATWSVRDATRWKELILDAVEGKK
ncbi:MAG: hypothetical protein MUF52_10595 [Syntrophobacteraceae bacterium]|nr:hypothetical protein [Syntrophobacteraceae bacterium]